MENFVYRMFQVPLYQREFAIRFVVVVLLSYTIFSVVPTEVLRSLTSLLLTVYTVSITARRCLALRFSQMAQIVLCILMCLPVIFLVVGIYLCLQRD